MPISRVRRATMNASTPCRPTTARIVARTANPPDRTDSRRSLARRRLTWVHHAHVRNNELGVDATHLRTKQGHDRSRVPQNARVDVERVDKIDLGIHVHERLPRDLATDIVIVSVTEDTDDFSVHRNVAALSELLAHRLSPLEILYGERLIDESHLSRCAPIVPGEISPQSDRNAQRLEIAGCDGIEEAPRNASIGWSRPALKRDLAVPSSAGEEPRCIRADGADAWHRREALHERGYICSFRLGS